MNKLVVVNSDLAVADAPNLDDLREFADRGYCTIARILEPDEQGTLDPEQEELLAHSLGMSTCRFSLDALRDISGVDRFRRELATHAKPVLVHSPTGESAAAFVLMDHGAGAGWDADHALAFAAELGVPVQDPSLVSLITGYIDGHIRFGRRAVARGARSPE